MDQHGHLVIVQAERLRGLSVENLSDSLDLEEVIAAAERAELVCPALARAR
jgi:hypothetical protein